MTLLTSNWLFQPRAIRRRHRDVGVEIEAREMRVPGSGREHPRRVGIVPHTPDRVPARGPKVMRPWMEALLMPAKAMDSSRTGMFPSGPALRPRRESLDTLDCRRCQATETL